MMLSTIRFIIIIPLLGRGKKQFSEATTVLYVNTGTDLCTTLSFLLYFPFLKFFKSESRSSAPSPQKRERYDSCHEYTYLMKFGGTGKRAVVIFYT